MIYFKFFQIVPETTLFINIFIKNFRDSHIPSMLVITA